MLWLAEGQRTNERAGMQDEEEEGEEEEDARTNNQTHKLRRPVSNLETGQLKHANEAPQHTTKHKTKPNQTNQNITNQTTTTNKQSNELTTQPSN